MSLLLRALYFFGCGFSVWWLSPYLAGTVEPWDAKYSYYSGFLFIFALPGGILRHPNISAVAVISWLGCSLGQIVSLFLLPGLDRSWWMLGAIRMMGGSLIAVVGIIAGYYIGNRIFRDRHKNQ